MKAYIVRDYLESIYSTVVFAESRGQARKLALSTDTCEYLEFTRIQAVRIPQLDKYYRGKSEMDWYNKEDRIAMVSEAGFSCGSLFDEMVLGNCTICCASEYCEAYQDYLKDGEERFNDGF